MHLVETCGAHLLNTNYSSNFPKLFFKVIQQTSFFISDQWNSCKKTHQKHHVIAQLLHHYMT